MFISIPKVVQLSFYHWLKKPTTQLDFNPKSGSIKFLKKDSESLTIIEFQSQKWFD